MDLRFQRQMPQIRAEYANGVSTNSENTEKQKPTIQNMNDLYKIWCSATIVYFPAAEASASVKARTEAVEKYVKDNNLDVDVSNLELFFKDVRENPSSQGMMSGEHYKLLRFQDYLENGYDPTKGRGKLEPSNPSIPNEKDLQWGQPDIDQLRAFLDANTNRSFNVFKE